jgi:tRNA uridine 5-carbamoylmethylation protein Kti12
MEPDKIVYILRSLPGSGGSTTARILAHGLPSTILSLDDYRKDHSGNYHYDQKQAKSILNVLDQKYDHHLQNGTPLIIIDNVHYSKSDVDHFRIPAEKAGYTVIILEIPHEDPDILAQRTIHGISKERIEKMMLRWDHIGYSMQWRRLLRFVRKRFKYLFHIIFPYWINNPFPKKE